MAGTVLGLANESELMGVLPNMNYTVGACQTSGFTGAHGAKVTCWSRRSEISPVAALKGIHPQA